jgi:hypothetical protein
MVWFLTDEVSTQPPHTGGTPVPPSLSRLQEGGGRDDAGLSAGGMGRGCSECCLILWAAGAACGAGREGAGCLDGELEGGGD